MDILFRIAEKGRPMRLVSQGKLCFFENGLAHLFMLKTNQTTTHPSFPTKWDRRFLFTETINSNEWLIVPDWGSIRQSIKARKYQKKYPQFKDFLECILSKKYNRYYTARECVEAINGDKLPDWRF